MKQIYLDNQATTPIDPKVLLFMQPWLKEKFGNASSKNHMYGWEADEAVEIAREKIASLISARPKEIIFTSGATEANNLAIQGLTRNYINKGKHIITVKTEHKAVLDVCNYLEKEGFIVTYLPVKKNGILDLDKLYNAIRSDTILVSVMHVNNEIGVVQPISKIGKLCNDNNIVFHVDAAQSIGKLPIDVNLMNIDLLSISGHKIYGPKGVGALYLRRKKPEVKLQPIMYGGGHERGLRSGTLAVSNIVGFGEACQVANNIMQNEAVLISELRDKMLINIQGFFSNSKVNGSLQSRLPGNLNICFPGINNESLIAAVPEVAFSSGASCTTSSRSASHVLLALGLSKNEAFCSLRFGIGRFNTKEEIQTATTIICKFLSGHH